jgi:hypothetical protein
MSDKGQQTEHQSFLKIWFRKFCCELKVLENLMGKVAENCQNIKKKLNFDPISRF